MSDLAISGATVRVKHLLRVLNVLEREDGEEGSPSGMQLEDGIALWQAMW